jgi:hypothetical protein
MSFTPEELREYIVQNFMESQINVRTDLPESSIAPEAFVPNTPSMAALPTPPSSFGNKLEDAAEEDEYDEEDDEEALDENKNYRYLYDNPLSNEFSFDRDYSKIYNISLCLYKINNDLNIPFLKFFFVKKDSVYMFPTMGLDMDPFTTINNSTQHIAPLENEPVDNDEIEEEFMKQCSLLFTNIMDQKIESSNNQTLSTSSTLGGAGSHHSLLSQAIYRGFIETTEEMSNNIFAFFDCTNFDFDEELNEGLWGTMSDIFKTHKIADIPIEESNYQLFVDNQVVVYIKNLEGIDISIPNTVYLCTNVEGTYKNVYYDENESPLTVTSLINPTVEHDIFDNVYMFSNEPLLHENVSKIKRYALFGDDALYFFNKGTPISDILNEPEPEGVEPAEKNVFAQSKIYDRFSTFCFYEGENKMWCVKHYDAFTEI